MRTSSSSSAFTRGFRARGRPPRSRSAGARSRSSRSALLDDIDVGELEGQTIEDYRIWKHGHERSERFPGGESLDDAARRYAAAFRRLLDRPERGILVVTHEIPVRYALNGAVGSDTLDGPAHEIGNCIPHLFDEGGLERAIAGIDRLVSKG